MRVTMALIQDTLREALARKIFLALAFLETMYVLFFLFVMKIDVVQGAMATISLFGSRPQEVDAHRLLTQVFGSVAVFIYTLGMVLAVFASSGLIPSVLEPGRIELLLSKPVSRHHILLGRYIGNVLLIGVMIAYMIVGVWLILSVKTGIWMPAFLYTIGTTVLVFAVLLTVVMLFGVIWESTAVSTLVTVALMIISPVLAQHEVAERLLSSDWSRALWKGLYYALPKVYDLGESTHKIAMQQPIESWMPYWSSGLFAALVLSISLVIFSKRDF